MSAKLPKPLVDVVDKNPDLFDVVTPIKAEVFERLLADHPNRAFVESVIWALRNGFWPWAEIPLDYPTILSHQSEDVTDKERLAFYIEQCEKEYKLGRFSEPFDHLQPGMACMPIWIILRNGKYRLITDHSYGKCSLNSLIDRDNRAFPLSSMQSFGRILRKAKQNANGRRIVIWKSDVSQAYRRIPMHKLWQALQATRLPDGRYAINRNNVFGGAASGRCWWSVSSLMLWIAEHVYGIEDLSDYVDDIFGWDYEDNVEYYEPYQKWLPARQAKLLRMWDELGIPHEMNKQLSGASLAVIGFQCDTDAMSLAMPQDSRAKLLDALQDFTHEKRPLRTVRQCQRLAGHVNWALNVAPRLRPGLASLYSKMYETPSAKYNPNARIHIRQDVIRELNWLRSHFSRSSGIYLFSSIAWLPDEADLTIYTDASLSGIGMWSPDLQAGFYARISNPAAEHRIFYYEAYVVVCAIHWAAQRAPSPRRLVIMSDNMNVVDIFSSMKARGVFNELLKFAVDILIPNDIDLRVIHISGDSNVIADRLSRGDIATVRDIDDALFLQPYRPPAHMPGAGL